MWLYVPISLPRIHCALHEITDPPLAIVYADMTAIMSNNILYNRYITDVGLVIYEAKSSID